MNSCENQTFHAEILSSEYKAKASLPLPHLTLGFRLEAKASTLCVRVRINHDEIDCATSGSLAVAHERGQGTSST